MKILAVGDFHLSDKRPRSRKDNYAESMRLKVREILQIARDEKVEAIIQPGDFTDSWESPDKFKTTWIKEFKNSPPMYTIPGQHDMRYHTSDIKNTPLGVLVEAIDNMHQAGENGISLENNSGENIFLYGAPWNQPIPKITTPKAFNILVTHRMIVMDKLWAAQENYEVAGTFMRKSKFDLVISGDNHTSFHYAQPDGRLLINCGSLMRSNIDQESHRPCVWVFDTQDILRQIYLELKVQPFSDVMDLDRAKIEKKISDQKNLKLEELEKKLSTKSRISGLDYSARVSEKVKELQREKKVSPLAVKIIGEWMGEE